MVENVVPETETITREPTLPASKAKVNKPLIIGLSTVLAAAIFFGSGVAVGVGVGTHHRLAVNHFTHGQQFSSNINSHREGSNRGSQGNNPSQNQTNPNSSLPNGNNSQGSPFSNGNQNGNK